MAQLGNDRRRLDGQQEDVRSLEKYQNNLRTLANVDRSQQVIAKLEAGDQYNSPTAQSGRDVPSLPVPPEQRANHDKRP